MYDQHDPPAGRVVYVPVQSGRSIVYVAWRVVRFTALATVWVALGLFKAALWPFLHLTARRGPGWWD